MCQKLQYLLVIAEAGMGNGGITAADMPGEEIQREGKTGTEASPDPQPASAIGVLMQNDQW